MGRSLQLRKGIVHYIDWGLIITSFAFTGISSLTITTWCSIIVSVGSCPLNMDEISFSYCQIIRREIILYRRVYLQSSPYIIPITIQAKIQEQVLSAFVCLWLDFFLNVHRLCDAIEGRLSYFLPRSLRTGWQINQRKIPWNTPPWLVIEHGPRWGQTVRFIHFPTELSWLTEDRFIYVNIVTLFTNPAILSFKFKFLHTEYVNRIPYLCTWGSQYNLPRGMNSSW